MQLQVHKNKGKKDMKFIQYFSKRILTFCAFALLLPSATVSQAAIWDTFKQKAESVAGKVGGAVKKGAQEFGGTVAGKLKELTSTAASKIKGGLSSALDKVRRLGPAAVVSQLQNQVENLGNKVSYMANCMLKGTCSQSERAAFIGISVLVLALTTATVGVTLTVAATSKEVDAVVATTSEEVKGWGPQAIFQRLTNTVNNFKQSLASLRTGILKKQLTRGQKKFLYGTALSIAALVTIAIGVGVGSYVYAQKKEAERQRLAAEEKIEMPREKPMPTNQPTDASAQELAKPIIIGGIAAAAGNFGKLFDKVIRVDESGKNIFQRTFKTVKAKLDEKTELAKKALAAVGEKKNELVAKSKKAYEEAVNSANELIAQVKGAGNEFINKALKDLFDIDYNDVKKAVGTFNASLADLSPKLASLGSIPTWNQLTAVQTNWNAVQTKGYALWNNLSSFLMQLAGRKKDREGWWGYLGYGTPQEESKEKRAELLKNYPLAFKFDYLLDIYPKFLLSVKNTNVAAAGNAAEQVLDQTGKIFQDVANIYSEAGIWGRMLLTNEMITPLRNIGGYMRDVGKNLKEFANNKPLAQLIKELPQQLAETPIKEWITRFVWAPLESLSRIKDITQTQIPQMIEANEQLQKALQQTTALSNTFMIHSANMWTFIQQTMVQELSKKPFQNYLNVAKQAVLKEATISKELFNDVILYTAGIVNYLSKLLNPLISMVENVNAILDKELITSENIAKLRDSATQLKAMTNELARLRNAAKAHLGIGR